MQVLGKQGTLAYEQWPSYDERLLVSDSFNLPIQVRHYEQQCWKASFLMPAFSKLTAWPALLKHNLVSTLMQTAHLASG